MLKLMNLRQAEQSLISCFLFTTSQGSPREKGKPQGVLLNLVLQYGLC